MARRDPTPAQVRRGEWIRRNPVLGGLAIGLFWGIGGWALGVALWRTPATLPGLVMWLVGGIVVMGPLTVWATIHSLHKLEEEAN